MRKRTYTLCNDCSDKFWKWEELDPICPNGFPWCVREPVLTEKE